MTLLHDLAQAAGLARVWHDAKGREHVVSDEALTAILAALGYPAGADVEARASLEAIAREREQAPAFLSVDVDAPLTLPSSLSEHGEAELALETGEVRALAITGGVLTAIAEPGYHRLRVGGHELVLAVAPRRCVIPSDLTEVGQRRLWGTAIQIPALHERPGAYGDFADLREAVRLLAGQGADAVAISPVHAPAPIAETFSPYSPSSRLFLNPALAGVTPGQAVPSRFRKNDEAGGELIDWPAGLRERHRQLLAQFAELSPGQRAEIEVWAARQGPALARHALYNALSLHLQTADWRRWPAEYHDPEGPAASRFAAGQGEKIAFHVYAQWLADRALAAVQGEAREGGMAIGLIADLAVGIDPGGSDAWALQDSMLSGLTIGAPPDPLGPQGQNWMLTGFSPQGLRRSAFAPWIATLRAALRHAGGVRIDHAFGLARLWVVPAGKTAADGAYLAYPFADMLRVIALESHRAGAIVVGEDLGTRPPGFVEPVADKALLGMRVLWFERDAEGFVPESAFASQAVAMTGTHDTATVAGWWSGRDLDWNRRLARGEDLPQQEQARDADRVALWSAIGQGAPQPAEDDPTAVVDAAVAHVGRTPSVLAIVPLEDLLALQEQPNLPGTIDEHPNWRRRLCSPLADLLAEPATARRIASLIEARTA